MAKKNSGLVLTGGGARAAYQAGVMKAVMEIYASVGFSGPAFNIFSGDSAGAINAAMLAMHVNDNGGGVKELCEAWENLKMEHIFRTGSVALLANATRWMRELSMGGMFGTGEIPFLLDSSPLKEFLKARIDPLRIRDHLRQGRLQGLAISTTNYATGSSVIFYDAYENVVPWARSNRLGIEAKLSLDHLLASTAIPILFPPVRIANCFYGDGGVRQRAPLSPPIHLGADRILAIGLRYYRTPEETMEMNQNCEMNTISLADIVGVLLNAGFLDSFDADLERLERINRSLKALRQGNITGPLKELREIKVLAIRPSLDLGRMASEEFDNFHALLRYLLKGLGTTKDRGWDLLSYLAFDKAYTSKLLRLGYRDGLESKEEILDFFTD